MGGVKSCGPSVGARIETADTDEHGRTRTNGVLLSWQSVSRQNYFLERGTNTGAPFSLRESNIAG
jgi:hypothetical protein